MIIGKIQLVDNIKREIPDNSTGQVSPRDVRQNMINIIDSVHMFTADHDLNALNFSTPNTRTTRAGQETLSKLHLQGYSSEDNSAFGYSALSDNYDGTKNTAIGSHSMGCNLYGDSNTAIGFNSLAGNVFGSGNVALGNFTLQRSKFGSFNIAIGHGAGYYVGSHDRYKLYIGSHSLEENDTCDNPLGSGLVPLMYGDMQNLKLGVATSGLHNYGALQVSGDISPSQDCQHNLGHSSYRWNDLYLCNSINESVYFSGDYVGFGANPPSGQGLVTVGGHIVPSLHNTYALGHPELRWDGYFNDITVSGTANITNAVYTTIEDCTYHCRTLYLASSGLCDDMGGWAPPCGYLHDEQIEGGGFVLQSSGVDYRRNYEFIFSAPDTTLTCLEEDTPYSRSSWNSNISIHVASGSHIKTDRTIGRDNLSLLSDNCCYGIFMKKDTDGIREDRTGINEIQLIEIDATGGTFTLTFDGQTTEIPIPYNASAARVKLALETLSNIGDGNVDVFKGSNSWEIRFTGTLGGKNVSQVTCNGAELTKTEEEERCTTTTYPGVDEIQKIVITADAGEWRLGHATRQVSSDCSSDTDYNSQLGGYFTDPIPYDISASDLQTKMRDCFTGMAGNVSVSLSTSGKRRTYTITFVSGLEETNVNPWLVDRYSLTLGDEECTDDETNEIINIELDNATGGTFNILTYLKQSDYDTDCPYYRSADIPFDATASEIDTILTATCAAEGWSQNGVDIDGEAAWNLSGISVSVSSDGSVVAIGAYGNDDAGNNAGHVRVYEWIGSAWVQRGNDIDGEAAGDASGKSVSLSSDGSVVAIGAFGNYGVSGPYSGHVRVYAWNGISWVQRGNDIDGEAINDYSGKSVSLSSDGTIVAIGSYLNDDAGTNAGHVRVYKWNGSAWVQRGNDIDGEAAEDWSGYSVSLSSDGSVVAIGTRVKASTLAGYVRVYAWNGSAWVQRGNDIDGEAAGDRSGWSVSLSGDGTILAIGAPLNDPVAGSAALASGHVRVYAWNGSIWEQSGADIDGEAADDRSGVSVSLSSDGRVVAIGAPYNDGGGTNAGHVRVYAASSSSTSCGSFNQNHPACVVPEWIAGVNHYVAVIPSAGSWTPERLDIDRGTDGHRIQVTGQPGDWTIEFGNTAYSSSFFNGKNIAPMRIDDSNLTGGVSLSTPEFTVVRTHEPIENAYNKISVQMIGSTKTERDSLRDGVFSYRIGLVMFGGLALTTRTLSADATISEVMQAMNETLSGTNANFFIPYISPGLVVGDPVYGDHEGKNKFWDSVGSYQEAVPIWGNDKLCAYNSRLDTDSTFLGTLLGEGEPWLGSTSTHMGWGWDGMLGEGLGGNFYQWQGFTRTFDILTHTGWSHNYTPTWQSTLADQALHVLLMSIEVVDYDPTIISKTEAENMISFIVAAPKATTRSRNCIIGVGNWFDANPHLGYGYDAEWSSNGSIRSAGNLTWYRQFSHTVDSYAALGDGIVGVQDGWSTDVFLRIAQDSAEVSSQASGPSYNCDTTGKVISTSWSWFNSNITQGTLH